MEAAQKRVEQRNYMIRAVLEFDDMMNQQREVIYSYRQEVMDSVIRGVLVFEVIDEMVLESYDTLRNSIAAEETPTRPGLLNSVNTTFPLRTFR